MTQNERLNFLIETLIDEQPQYSDIKIPDNTEDKKRLLRSLFNVRMPNSAGEDFLRIQDEYLQEEIRLKGITDENDLKPIKDKIYLWQGDITTLRCGAIVNAANSGMLGCFVPCHGCIDNAIHTYAGIQLRAECAAKMKGREEPVGAARITKAYNLPCSFIIHTVGPLVRGRLTERDCVLLSSCYSSCLEAADKNNIRSIAFCCISTGEYHFPNEKAAEIAIRTVEQSIERFNIERVIFNVFKDKDYQIYKRYLTSDRQVT